MDFKWKLEEGKGSYNRMLEYKLKGNEIKDARIASFGQMAEDVTERNWEKTSESSPQPLQKHCPTATTP